VIPCREQNRAIAVEREAFNERCGFSVPEKKLYIIDVVNDEELAASALTQGNFDKQLNICLLFVNALYLELPADFTVGVLKSDGIYRRNPKD